MSSRIYCGTWNKYNNGSLAGKWFDLSDYADMDDFIAACQDFHKNEEDPELMFQDWEGIPAVLVNYSWVSPDVWELMEVDNQEAAQAYIECFGEWDKDDFEDRYRGHWASWVDMATELIEESGDLESIPEHLRYYFDYEAYARDLRCGGDFCENDGHFFCNN